MQTLPPQSQNITTRKKQNSDKECNMHNEPPKLNDENFPVITNTNKQLNSYNITVIPETRIEQQQNEETKEFLLPSVVSTNKFTNSTPEPLDTSATK